MDDAAQSVDRAQLTADVSQRLTERRTIIDRLLAEPTMKLPTMQDIAGCRAVLPDLAAIRHLVDGWHDAPDSLQKLEIVEEYNYLEVPRPSGYQAYHLIVSHEGKYGSWWPSSLWMTPVRLPDHLSRLGMAPPRTALRTRARKHGIRPPRWFWKAEFTLRAGRDSNPRPPDP